MTPITTTTNTAGAPIRVGAYPQVIAITPNGKTGYATGGLSTGPVTMTPLRDRHQHFRAAGPGGDRPVAIAITPTGKTAYVVNSGSDKVTPVVTASNTAGRPIPVGDRPEAIAITPTRCHRP